jgi:hypothetical protein
MSGATRAPRDDGSPDHHIPLNAPAPAHRESAKPSPLSPALPERKRDVLSLKVAGYSHENHRRGVGHDAADSERQLLRARAVVRRGTASFDAFGSVSVAADKPPRLPSAG